MAEAEDCKEFCQTRVDVGFENSIRGYNDGSTDDVKNVYQDSVWTSEAFHIPCENFMTNLEDEDDLEEWKAYF